MEAVIPFIGAETATPEELRDAADALLKLVSACVTTTAQSVFSGIYNVIGKPIVDAPASDRAPQASPGFLLDPGGIRLRSRL